MTKLQAQPVRAAAPGIRQTRIAERLAPAVFVAPALLAVLALIMFPIGYTLWMSLHRWHIASAQPPMFVGLANYGRLLFDDPRFSAAAVRTFLFAGLAVTMQLVFGTALAFLFNRSFPGRGLLRTIAILPMVATPVAIALVFVMMMHPTLGVLNYLLQLIGLPPSLWIYNQGTVLLALAMVDTWTWSPLVMLIVLAGLAALPAEPFEAATVDGASARQQFYYITLPLLRPALVVAALFRLIDALKTFDIIFVMTQGGPGQASETINLYLYNVAFSYFDMGYASAMVVVFFMLILACAAGVARIRRAA